MSILDAYDSIPYDRLSLAETHPDQLAVLATLYGINCHDPQHARVLELGCASGGNLIPMAWFMPGARFVGIDLSQVQVTAGQALIDELGLANIVIQRADLADCDLGDEGFDYIIAHGLYSWVPADVRSALLALLRRQLRPGGVAYVSFNALPGWHMRGMLRQMLLFQLRDVAAPAQRVQVAREFLGFLAGGLHDLHALSAQYLRTELAELGRAPDSYLYHEYLASVNEPVLFTDFVAQVSRAGLSYLCNTDLHLQFPATLGESVESALATIDDALLRQQYLDFLANRNFHQALLVRDDERPLADPDYERFTGFALFSDLMPPHKPDLRRTKPQPFSDNRGNAHPVTHPLTKATLAHLYAVYPHAVAFAELQEIACAQVAAHGDARVAGQTDHLFGELFQLFAHRALSASLHSGGTPPGPVDRPSATALARAEARSGRLVDTRHASLVLDSATCAVIAALDGTLDHATIAQILRLAGARQRQPEPALLLRKLARYGALR
ncbi:MAG: methyltransferase regulatory domain-containing protein [Chromatiaceae bacterium]|nr:class I SAM-dependent methyltransferase [Gammaproteobacteria bacterium]MCP5300515.1 methyltransferase regulatory domain-containing protein [Chromatiaceae bacterium]MCP5422587.1 methyltransferase regulatory domain-containing protein [Chromatiaceae bacterium]